MTLFTTVDPRPIHFMGIAGAGMSGLALLAKEQAVAITGCDNDPTGAADLAANGVEIWRGRPPEPGGWARAGRGPAPADWETPAAQRARPPPRSEGSGPRPRARHPLPAGSLGYG